MTAFSWTNKTTTGTVFSETISTDFYNLKNKADGARRYGYANKIVKFVNPDGFAFRTEVQTTLNGSRYQSSKYGAFVATEAEARVALTKTIAGALKRYAKLATDPASKIEHRPAPTPKAVGITPEFRAAREYAKTFPNLSIGDTFDFIDDREPHLNSFYHRCRKISARKYEAVETGQAYEVGSIHAKVFHTGDGK